MAKQTYAKVDVYSYPSRFCTQVSKVDQSLTEAFHKVKAGEVADMPQAQLAVINKLIAESEGTDLVVIRDEHKTPYATSRKVLDNGMADPNRYTRSRLEYLCVTQKGSRPKDEVAV